MKRWTNPTRAIDRSRRRRGVASMLAMLYLVLFAVLAIGFYAATTIQSQVVHADERATRAQLAAETGLDFMRYQLARVSIPPATPTAGVTDELYNDLVAQMATTENFRGLSIGRTGTNVINLPASGYVKLTPSSDTGFSATVTDWPETGKVVVKVVGYHLGMTRAVQLDFSRVPRESTIFANAVASKGQIVVSSGNITTLDPRDAAAATMLSAMNMSPAVKVSGQRTVIGGDITILDGSSVSVAGGTVGGSSIVSAILSDHVHSVPEPPEFPTFDPTVYRQYATNVWQDGVATQTNIRIPAGSGTPQHPVKFNGNDTVRGIIYIESPNNVQFNGTFNLQGCIVMATSNSTTDTIEVSGNLSQTPVPADAQFDSLRAASGVSILAPNAAINMTGNAGAKDSRLRGSVICNTFTFNGSAQTIIDGGTLMTYKESANSVVLGGKDLLFSGTGDSNKPKVGMSFSQTYSPDTITYQELLPE